jgi:hypothetical protein
VQGAAAVQSYIRDSNFKAADVTASDGLASTNLPPEQTCPGEMFLLAVV